MPKDTTTVMICTLPTVFINLLIIVGDSYLTFLYYLLCVPYLSHNLLSTFGILNKLNCDTLKSVKENNPQ